MSPISVAEYNDRQNRSLQRILDQLERSNARTEQHYARVRKYERKPYRGIVSIFLPSEEHPILQRDGRGVFTVWSYSLSQGGMGFVTPWPIDQQSIVVGVHLPNGQTRWFPGNIVRKRTIPEEGFFDYGVAFHAAHAERSETPDAAIAGS